MRSGVHRDKVGVNHMVRLGRYNCIVFIIEGPKVIVYRNEISARIEM